MLESIGAGIPAPALTQFLLAMLYQSDLTFIDRYQKKVISVPGIDADNLQKQCLSLRHVKIEACCHHSAKDGFSTPA